MSGSNILIIDDEQLVLMNYCDILEEAGYVVSTAASFTQGMNIVSSRDFELMICDHDLPDGKGVDIVKKMINDGRDTPVIYLSAALPSILDEIKSLTIVKAVLSKPIEKDVLLETVKTFVRKIEEKTKYPRLIGNDERFLLLDNSEEDKI